jgi:hypothetical protein
MGDRRTVDDLDRDVSNMLPNDKYEPAREQVNIDFLSEAFGSTSLQDQGDKWAPAGDEELLPDYEDIIMEEEPPPAPSGAEPRDTQRDQGLAQANDDDAASLISDVSHMKESEKRRIQGDYANPAFYADEDDADDGSLEVNDTRFRSDRAGCHTDLQTG